MDRKIVLKQWTPSPSQAVFEAGETPGFSKWSVHNRWDSIIQSHVCGGCPAHLPLLAYGINY